MADVYKRTVRARAHVVKNEVTAVDEEFLSEAVTFTEMVHQRVVIGTNMATPAEIDMSYVGTAATVFLSTDRALTVCLNTTANPLTLADTGMIMMVGTVTHVYVQNTNTTYTATIEYVITD